MRTGNDHVKPTQRPNIHEYLALYPSLIELEIHWNLQLAKTDLSLSPHLSSGPGSPTHALKSLRLFIGNGGNDRAAELGACPAAVEMGDIIAHLCLPELEVLMLDIKLTFGFPDTKESWESLVVHLGLVKRYGALKDLTIKVTLAARNLKPQETQYWVSSLMNGESIDLSTFPHS